jgi:hypothetical protein
MKAINIRFFASLVLMILFFIIALITGDVIFEKLFLAISIVLGLKFFQISNQNSIADENN